MQQAGTENVQALGNQFTTACSVLYNESSSREERREADRWITEFQKKSESWAVVDIILSQDHAPLNLAFLSAKTFHAKLRYDYHEQVKPEEREMLRDKLLGHLVRQFGLPERRAVATQLCLAVATLLIQMEEWENPIKDLASRLGSSADSSLSLIELLQIIPEEHKHCSLNISCERRSKLSIEMFNCCSDVLGFLESCASASEGNVDIQARIYRCATAWISIVEFPGEELARSPLLVRVFDAVASHGDLFETAIRVVIAILHQYRIQGEPGHMAVMNFVVPKIFALEGLFRSAVEQEDEDTAEGVAKIFTQMGIAYMRMILGEVEMHQGRLVELVLLVSSHPTFEVAQISWDFWKRLVEEFFEIRDRQLSERRGQQFSPCFERLVPLLLKQLEIPASHPNKAMVSTRHLEEDFYYNRRDVAELLRQVCSFLQTQTVLTIVNRELEIAAGPFLRQAAENDQNQNHHPHLPRAGTSQGEARWERVEALLFAADAVAEACTFTSSSSACHVAIDYVMAVILRLPNVALLLRETGTRIFGSYAKFLRFNPQKLDPVVSYILESLVLAPQIAHVASRSLLSICDHCRKDMMFAGIRLFELSQGQNENVRTIEREDLIVCLSFIISAQPPEQAIPAAQHVAGPAARIVTQLGEALSNGVAPQSTLAAIPGGIEALTFSLRTLEFLIRFGRDPGPRENGYVQARQPWEESEEHPCMGIFFQLWQSLCIVTRAFCSNTAIVERVAALFKVAIRNFEPQFEQHLAQFLQLMVECFQQSSTSAFLYAAGIAMERFAKRKPELRGDFVGVVNSFTSQVVQLIRTEADFIEHPDIVEDFFITMDRLMHKMPKELLVGPCFQTIFQLALKGVHIDHREANKAVLSFLGTVFEVSNSENETRPLVAQVFQQHGQELVNKLVQGVAGASPRTRISSDADGALDVTLYHVTQFCAADQDMRQILSTAALSCAHVNPELANWFVHELWRVYIEDDSRRPFTDVLYEFSFRARQRLRRSVKT